MPHLNASQRQAIDWALTADNLAILHGPPGTGKTTTVAELIRQAVRQGERVLACAPSNTGVDNLLERLVAMDVLAVRVGHPARVQARLQEHSLDALVENDPSMVAVHRLLRQSEQAARLAQRHTRKRPEPGVKHGHRLESRQLREEAKRLERQILDSWLDRAQVICATTNFDPEVLGPRQFDLGVIDEACQSTEPGYWPVVLRCDRLVLAGDHCQLPPTVLSTEAVQNGYGVSMMERLAGHYGETTTRLLTTQYRMHRNIMQFSSSQFYQDQLIADASVAEHQLVDLSEVRASRWSETPATFLDTAGAGWDEEPDPDGESRLNRKEAQVVIQVVEEMVQSGLAPIDIAVIAPYSAQVRHLRSLSLFADLEIDTVDGFQGREKEAVVITLVRSNTTGEIGFLSDTRRMNVALTRARRKLIVLGDSSTLSNHPFYASMIQYFESIGAYQSVWSHFQVT
jgi:predicted DNA helicase